MGRPVDQVPVSQLHVSPPFDLPVPKHRLSAQHQPHIVNTCRADLTQLYTWTSLDDAISSLSGAILQCGDVIDQRKRAVVSGWMSFPYLTAIKRRFSYSACWYFAVNSRCKSIQFWSVGYRSISISRWSSGLLAHLSSLLQKPRISFVQHSPFIHGFITPWNFKVCHRKNEILTRVTEKTNLHVINPVPHCFIFCSERCQNLKKVVVLSTVFHVQAIVAKLAAVQRLN
jgi:hypothetical protein